MASGPNLKQPAGNMLTPVRRNRSSATASASSASSFTARYMSPTQSTKNKAAAANRSTSTSGPSLLPTNSSTPPPTVSDDHIQANEDVLVEGIQGMDMNAGPRAMESATAASDRRGRSSLSVSRTTATTPDPSAQQSAEQQPRGQSLLEPDDAPPSDTDTFHITYPMRAAEVGDEEAFLAWFPVPDPSPVSETATKFFWCFLLNWFTVGVLHTMTSFDLNERQKNTPSSANEAVNRARCSGSLRLTTTDLIPVNHNVPDWVIAYIIGNPYGVWIYRICMVITAKPAGNWNTAMSQIVVYMTKALLTDGCAMGLAVAGTQYRFLWWDTDTKRLYIVVPATTWRHGESITLETLVHDFTYSVSGRDWDAGASSAVIRGRSRRNLYRILRHLDQQTRSMVEDQQRGRDTWAINQRPVLNHAKWVEITEVWENIPGPSVPPSNGIHVPTSKHQARPTDGGSSLEQGFSAGTAGGEGGREEEGNTGNTGDDFEDDEQARYQAMWDSLGDMSPEGKSACLFFHDFHRDHVIPRRRKDLIAGWAQGVVNGPVSPEGVSSSTDDLMTPSESADL